MPPSRTYRQIGFVASETTEAQSAKAELEAIYGSTDLDAADAIVALGGDGLMLQTLHDYLDSGTPIYGMNCGSVGFMMNEYRTDNLSERLTAATETEVHPLVMAADLADGRRVEAKAINEVSMLRQTYQAAKLQVSIDGKVRLEELICDGILVATPAGSTAYNLSAHGPILPIYAPLLALTPISPFRPRHWRGALLPNRTEVQIHVLESDKRPVSVVADHTEFRDVRAVRVAESQESLSLILSDADHSWDERILTEQFNF